MSCPNKKSPNSISPTFCSLAWEQLHVTPMGIVKPCCIFDGPINKDDGTPLRISDMEVEEIWNSNHLKAIRKKMLNGEEVSECAKCINEEKVYSSSDRIISFNETPKLLDLIEKSKENGNVETLPKILNLKIGNVCNLKCRMCQPLDSCQVDAEFSTISKHTPQIRSFDNAAAFDYYYNSEPVESAANWISNELAMRNLKLLLKDTVHLSLAGGEIAFTKEAVNLLKECVDLGYSKNIELVLSSNLTIVSDSFLKILASFKLTIVAASIDGVGKAIEYIRYPSKWSIIESNFLKILMAPENIVPVIAPTVQIYNVFEFINVLNFLESIRHPKWENRTPCHNTILYTPKYLSIRNLPKKIRKIAQERLETYLESSYYANRYQVFKDQIKLLVETLKMDNEEGFEENLSHFMMYTLVLDKERSQSFAETFPELNEMLKEFQITPKFPSENNFNYTYFRYRDIGFEFQKNGIYNRAIEMFNKAFEIEKTDTDLIFSMALVYFELAEYEKSKYFLNKTLEIKPDHHFALLELKRFSDS